MLNSSYVSLQISFVFAFTYFYFFATAEYPTVCVSHSLLVHKPFPYNNNYLSSAEQAHFA